MSDSVQSNMFGNASASSAVTSDAPAARRPVDTARLKVVPSPHAKLSPAQQRFNKLLSRVDNLGRQVEDFQRLADQVRGPHLASMSEMHREMAAGQRQMLVFLHERLQRKGLTAAQQKATRNILLGLLQLTPQGDRHEGDTADETLAQLRAQYAPAGSADQRAAHDEAMREEVLDMAQDVLGDALDREAMKAIESPQDMIEALLQQARDHEDAHQERLAARRAKRPPTARQRKVQEQAQDAKSALRSIYRQLASALHPDREIDPAERERKSALMVQVNTAYERGDLMALLRLQLQAEQVDEAHIARMADDKLAVLSLLLKEQVAALQNKLAEAEMGLSSELGVLVSATMTQPVVLRLLRQEQQDHADLVAQMRADLEQVHDDVYFKRWLREQAALSRAQARQDAFFARMAPFL